MPAIPSLSVAFAPNDTMAGPTKLAFATGDVMLTLGATFVLTVIVTGAEVVIPPLSSVALAVTE